VYFSRLPKVDAVLGSLVLVIMLKNIVFGAVSIIFSPPSLLLLL
jgi:hypothetical protein